MIDHSIPPVVHALTRPEGKLVSSYNELSDEQWASVAQILARIHNKQRIIDHAKKTPYKHLPGYMDRWWLFNPTPPESNGLGRPYPKLPSIRVHHILRADNARDHHNHVADARTIILDGWYVERRNGRVYRREAGDTATIRAEEFHSIEQVSPGGVWTLFFFGEWQAGWGFDTPDGFVPWDKYLKVNA